MNILRNLCFLCLSSDKKLISQYNFNSSILEIFGYIFPEYVFQNSERPSICNNCLHSLKNIYIFRQKCIECIKTYMKYVQVLKHGDESSRYLSLEIIDISNKQKCEMSKDIQNNAKLKAKTLNETDFSNSNARNNKQMFENLGMAESHMKKKINEKTIIQKDSNFENEIYEDIQNDAKIKVKTKIDEEINSEKSETDCSTLETGNNKQMLGKFEMAEFHMKKEINEELMIKDDLNLFENELFEDIQNDAKMKVKTKIDEEINSEKSETDCSNSETGNNKQMLGKFEMAEFRMKKEINEETIIKEDSNLFENELFEDIQNDAKMKVKTKIDEEINSEKSETDCSNSETGNNKQMLGKFEMAEFRMKKEINEETIIKEDSNLFENELFEDIQNDAKMKVKTKIDEEINSEKSETDCSTLETGNNKQMLGKFEMAEFHMKKEINEETIIKEDSNLFENENSSANSDYSEFQNMENEQEEDGHIPSNDSIEMDSNSTHPDTDQTDGKISIDVGKPHKCDVCSKSFKQLCRLKYHYRIHTGDKPYSCEICQKSFRTSSLLIVHERIHNVEKKYSCEICHKSFSQLPSLKAHGRTHANKKPFQCPVCEKPFRDSSTFMRHKRTHTGQKPYRCEVCHKTFTRASTLKEHRQIHSGIRPFKCSVCSRSFGRSSNMKIHELTHINAKPFTCTICHKSFTRLATLQAHSGLHSGSKPHKCSVCERTFRTLPGMKNHESKHKI